VEIAAAYATATEITERARLEAAHTRAELQQATDEHTRKTNELHARQLIETELLAELVTALHADGLLIGGEVSP
jgi:hypothetical protein